MRDYDALVARLEVDSSGNAARRSRRSQSTELVELCAELDLWHADDEPYASIIIDGHRETWPLRSRALRGLLARRYYAVHERTPGRQAIEDALAVLSGRALHEGDARTVHTRVAAHGEAIYIDLCDARWRAIEITGGGWRIVERPPVHFVRRRGMLPLPEPVRGGDLAALARYVRVADDRDLRAIIAWLLQAYRPTGPYPVLILGGEQGSGKSMTARVLRSLIDPSVAPIRTMPRDERDLIIAARNGWVIALDNLSGAPPWLSDALCRLATGGGMSTRELYTDADEILIDVQRPACCNGIDAIATRPDLADRAIVVTLDAIPDTDRRPEAQLWAAFAGDAPGIIGAICDAVSCALRRVADVRLARLPRMADHALWIEAAAPALGWPSGQYAADYLRARDEIVGAAVDESPVGIAIVRLMERDGTWSGTATELLAALADVADPGVTHGRLWPASPRGLANALARLAPALRARGIEVTRARTGHHRQRAYTLGQVRDGPSASSAPSAHPTVARRMTSQDVSGRRGMSPHDADDPTVRVASATVRDSVSADVSGRPSTSRADDADGADGVLRDRPG
ncbi:MAG TPA: hypothetical protein VF193_01040 [Steroidobacter sp.]